MASEVGCWTCLVKGKNQMQSLTTEQKETLVEIIKDEFGEEVSLDEFTDILLGMLEDVAGFEAIPEQEVNKLTNQLWKNYHG
jgi:hypothetical protein